jgi:Prophage minor tail protein Z (GPZ)
MALPILAGAFRALSFAFGGAGRVFVGVGRVVTLFARGFAVGFGEAVGGLLNLLGTGSARGVPHGAPLGIKITFDAREVHKMLNDLERNLVPRVIARTLNDTADQVQRAASRSLAFELGRQVGLRAKGFQKAIKIIRANPGRLVATLVASGKPIPLIDFNARQVRAGVSAAPLSQRRVYKGAFISRMPSGHRGVFRRRTRQRLPIREMYGPGVPQAFLGDKLLNLMHAEASRRLQPNFERAWRAIVPARYRGRG